MKNVKATEVKMYDADLTLKDLEVLAEEIRMILTNGNGMTIEEYINCASSFPLSKLGYRKAKAIQCEVLLESFFPDEVYRILKERVSQYAHYYSNESDKQFMSENAGRGYKWIAKKMYTDSHGVSKQAKRLGLKIQTKLVVMLTPQLLDFIRNHADKGATWISKNSNISVSAVKYHAHKMGITLANPQVQHQYVPEEDAIIKENLDKGSSWVAKKLGRSLDSVVGRAKILHLKFPMVHRGKLRHKFTPEEDKVIASNADKGAAWLSKHMNIPIDSIQGRARIRSIALRITKRKYTDEDNKFIVENLERGIPYLASQFDISVKAMERRVARMNKVVVHESPMEQG